MLSNFKVRICECEICLKKVVSAALNCTLSGHIYTNNNPNDVKLSGTGKPLHRSKEWCIPLKSNEGP